MNMNCEVNPMGKKLEHMPRRVPVNGTFELTVRCNLHCKMCLFRHDDSENADIMAKELTAAEWIDLARQAAEAGTFNLLLTGGEPLLRPDFCEIYEGIYRQGFLITLYTNATLVTSRVMETLRKYPPHKIGVTIYGATPETYGRVCGTPNAFQQALDGIHQLQTLPSILEFRMTIIKDNYHEADAIEALVQREFGPEYRVTQPRIVNKAVRGACADVESCRLDPEENIKLFFRRSINVVKQYVGDAYDEKNVVIVHNPTPKECMQKEKITLFGCDAGMSSYAISWDGKLLGCQMLGLFSTDARSLGFSKAWKLFPQTVHIPPMDSKCIACTVAEHCNSCLASRYAETGSLVGCPEYACRDATVMSHLIEKRSNAR